MFHDSIDDIKVHFESCLYDVDGERKPDSIFLDITKIIEAKITTPDQVNLNNLNLTPDLHHEACPWKLIVMGAPASGKGQQCEQLVKSLGLVHISTGEVYRSAKGTALGKKADALKKAGQATSGH